MDNHTRILNRIQKMLTLANDAGATEGERDNALRMAHATLAKHNLEMADLDSVKRERVSGEERIENITTFYGRPWARQTCQAVASLFFCSYVYTSHKKATNVRHYFLGRKSNAVTAALVSEFVVTSIMREGKRQQRREAMGNPWLRTFCWGAATRIQERVREIREAAEKPPETKQPGTALVLANVYEVERQANQQFLAKLYPRLGKGQTGKGHQGGDAFARGKSYGNSVQLNTQIGN